jgi:50S ribosomal protein L16 3-hydroxylase
MQNMAHDLLGKLSAEQFLRRHWQKKPLLVRNAFVRPALTLLPADLFALATRDDVQSRIVMQTRGSWQVRHGPFRKSEWARLPKAGWTLLVQGIEQVLPEAAQLLQAFSFIPHSRMDDLMASYAPSGGGVGPHFDSYDVFLIQGEGKRQWKISTQRDLDLVDDAPLRLLKRFRAQQEWTLDTGDMLYLPPRFAHDGVALTPSVTLSVGFRAPSAQEINARFLDFLQDRLQLEGMYADPDLRTQIHPAQISRSSLRKISQLLKAARWNAEDVAKFAGSYLTEPKPEAVFAPPASALTRSTFATVVRTNGLRLDLKSRMLFHGGNVYINGELHRPKRIALPVLVQLADQRVIGSCRLGSAAARLLYEWYLCGYVQPG